MQDKPTPTSLSRRGFFSSAGSLALSAGALVLPAMTSAETLKRRARANLSASPDTEPFYGAHQSGIITPKQRQIMFAAFNLDCGKQSDVIALLQRWTEASARMCHGASARPLGTDPNAAPLDGGSALGLSPAQLTITFGFGPGLFARDGVDRYGLNAKRPGALVDLPKFNGDQLVAEKSGGDLCVQACANDPQVVFHAIRELVALADGVASLKWVQTGFDSPPRAGGTGRNLMGFKDCTMNPDASDQAEMNRQIWVGDEGGWMKNGSYLVVRRIRIALEHWDRSEAGFQQEVVGRDKQSGAPLGKKHEHDTLNLAARDADGNPMIPEHSHARLAAAAENGGAEILRRAYSYNDGANFYSERWPPWRQGIMLDAGLFFAAYQRDPRTGFIRINSQLASLDAMNQYTTHVGSGIFACPAGVAPGSYVGADLFV